MRWITLFALLVAVAGLPVIGADTDAPAPAAAEEPVLEGIVLERPSGGFLTLTMNGRSLVVRFFDEEKMPVPADVTRGFVRFQFSNRSPERRPLNPTEDGTGLTHGEPLRPPHIFKVFLTLVSGTAEVDEDSERDAEKYVVDFP